MGFAASIHALIQIKSNTGVESQRKKHKLRRKREKKQERRRTRVRDACRGPRVLFQRTVSSTKTPHRSHEKRRKSKNDVKKLKSKIENKKKSQNKMKTKNEVKN